jgi:methionyl-tRNA formyltransferase
MTKKEDLRIVFMGTPEFAVTILDKIITEGYNVVGCVTVPDKPAGRGQKIHESAIKQCALEKNLHLLQPEKLKSTEFIEELSKLNADVFVVIAFRMLPEVVWKMPRLGTFNLHGSLLPQYRGAAPINWAVINGETETGVTTFFLNEEIDTGEIILQDKMSIGENETAGEVHDRMMHLGAQTVVKTLNLICSGQVATQKQESTKQLKPAPKLFRENCKIDLSETARHAHNQILGLSPYPAAWMLLKHTSSGAEKTLKILRTVCQNGNYRFTGKFKKDGKQLFLPLNDGLLEILELQLEGKKRMTAQDFLLGFPIDEWKILV